MATVPETQEPLLLDQPQEEEDAVLDVDNLLQTDPHTGLTDEEFKTRLERFGPNALPEAKKNPILELLAHFWGPMPIMIWISIILEAVNGIHDGAHSESWTDVAVLCGLQLVNGLVGWYEERKAGDAIAALKSSLSPKAHVKRGGKWAQVEAVDLVPGDIVSLAIGGAVPADCQVLPDAAAIQVDQAALTGESMPVKMKPGDTAKMGSSVTTGETEAMVTGTGANTFFGKTADMISSVDEIGHVQYILWIVASVLTVVSILVVTSLFIYLIHHLGWGEGNFFEALSVCVIILVASIPIAQEVVCTSTLALGARQLASAATGGAIVSRLAAIEELAGMHILCSDKTGTLTTGHMEMQPPIVLAEKSSGLTSGEVLRTAMLATKWNEQPRDAIDRLVLTSPMVTTADRDYLSGHSQLEYEPFDPSTKRTMGTVKADATGEIFRVVKGAPQVVIDLCKNTLSKEAETIANGHVTSLAERGVRALAIAKANGTVEAGDEEWVLVGLLTFLDPPRVDSIEVIKQAQELGIQVKMLTGDQKIIAKDTCTKLGMGNNVLKVEDIPGGSSNANFAELCLHADGFAEVFPEHKFEIVETFRKSGFVVGMTGDGVNDAPALKRADCGIAVEGATDAARAAADIVLTAPGLSTIVTAIKMAREIFQRLRNYVIYRVACTIQLICFFFFAVLLINNFDTFDEQSWAGKEQKTYFMLPVFSLVLITILNDGTIISIAYDNVEPSTGPEKWELPKVFTISLVLGSVACVSSLLICQQGTFHGPSQSNLAHSFLLDEWLDSLNLPTISYYELQALLYLKISISDFLTVFSARTRGPFWSRAPGRALLCAAGFSLTISTLLAKYWSVIIGGNMEGITWKYVGLVWVYCLIWWMIQDMCKVGAYYLMDQYSEYQRRATEKIPVQFGGAHTSSFTEVRRKSELRQVLAHTEEEERRRSSQK